MICPSFYYYLSDSQLFSQIFDHLLVYCIIYFRLCFTASCFDSYISFHRATNWKLWVHLSFLGTNTWWSSLESFYRFLIALLYLDCTVRSRSILFSLDSYFWKMWRTLSLIRRIISFDLLLGNPLIDFRLFATKERHIE